MSSTVNGSDVRLAEIIASMALATDLGLGQPMEHVLHSCVLAQRLAEDVGLDESERAIVYYVALLAWLGCHVDSHEHAAWFGDDEGVRLALRGYIDPIREGQEPPARRVHDQFIEKGGRFYVCPICFKDRELDEAQLVDNAELKGATPLMQFAGDGAMTFTY